MQIEKNDAMSPRGAQTIESDLNQKTQAKEVPWPVMWASLFAFFFGVKRMQEAIMESLLQNEMSEEQIIGLMTPIASQAKKAALITCGALGLLGLIFAQSSAESLRVVAAFMVALSVWLAVKHLSGSKQKSELGAKGALQLLWKRAKGE